MKISHKINIIIILPVFLGLIFLGMMQWSNHLSEETRAQQQVLQNIVQDTFHLSLLTHEVSTYPEEMRAREQWRLKYAILGTMFKSIHIQEPEAEALLKRMQKDLRDLLTLFDKLKLIIDKKDATDADRDVITLSINMITGGISIKVQALVSAALNLTRLVDRSLVTRKERMMVTIMGLTALFTVLLGFGGLLSSRSILLSLQALHKSTEIVADGDLDHRIETTAPDELGQLSRAFDRMVDRLKNTLASRDSLNQEIAERKQVEQELVEHRYKLEEQVLNRTADLEKSRRAAVSLMQDAEIEKRRAEEALEKMNESDRQTAVLSRQIETILSATRSGFDIIDAEYNVRYIDPGWQKIYGDPTGKKCYEYYMDRREACPGCRVREALETKEIVVSETMMIKENKPVHVTIAPFETESGEWLAAQIKVDITERKAMENALVKSKELAETANRAKSDFLSRMSHELRTPLNAIMGYAQILQRRNQNLDDIQEEGLAIIYDSGQHLLSLINDILDLAKVEAGRMELSPIPIHFPSFLKGVAAVARSRAEPKSLEFTLEHTTPLPDGIRVDEVRLRQILLNFLSNAVKYTDKGGVTLRTGVFKSETKGQKLFRFEVIDTGIGISEKKLEKIFLPFEQAGAKNEQVTGAGLGLAIAHQLATLMGG